MLGGRHTLSAPLPAAGAGPRRSGTTAQLLDLCAGYFVSYIGTGLAVKWFTGGLREPRMSDMAYLFNNTLGSTLLCTVAVLLLGWWRNTSGRTFSLLGLRLPVEMKVIFPSGVCTAVIIPATTLLYTLPISVMVAMVIMRGSVIVISRAVDAVQIRQGLLKKRVLPEENWAVVFALLALGTNLLLAPFAVWMSGNGIDVTGALGISPTALEGSFDFVHQPLAMTVLVLYIVAYSIRLYIMNWFKNTRSPGDRTDNRSFFALEQLSASGVILVASFVVAMGPAWFGWADERVIAWHQAAQRPDPAALLSGIPFALVAFFSVFLFMFEGRTATFAGVVNRLTSLLGGTASTLLLAWWFRLKPPSTQDWVSFGFILVAVAFLTRAEQRRMAERAHGGVAKA